MKHLIILMFFLVIYTLDIDAQRGVFIITEEPATYQGMKMEVFAIRCISHSLNLSDSKKQECTDNAINLSLLIDTIGRISDIRFNDSIDIEYNNKIVEILKSTSGQWIASKQGGKRVFQTFKVVIPTSGFNRNCSVMIDLYNDCEHTLKAMDYYNSIEKLNLFLAYFPTDTVELLKRAKCKLSINDKKGACLDLETLDSKEAIMLKKKYCKKKSVHNTRL